MFANMSLEQPGDDKLRTVAPRTFVQIRQASGQSVSTGERERTEAWGLSHPDVGRIGAGSAVQLVLLPTHLLAREGPWTSSSSWSITYSSSVR